MGEQNVKNAEVLRCEICGEGDFAFLYEGKDRLHHLDGQFGLYRCKTCSLITIHPALSDETLGRYYPDDYMNYHNSDGSAEGAPRSKALYYLCHPFKALNCMVYSKILGQNRPFSPGPGKKVLDVGCGDGAYLLAESAAGVVCYGVDISAKAIERMQQKDPSIRAHCGTLSDAKFESAFFDAVNMCNVLEHVNDAKGLLREGRRILKKDGRIRVQVPNARSLTFSIFRRFWLALDTPRHVYVFSSKNLQRLFASVGLEVEEWRTIENSYDVIGSSVYVSNALFRRKDSVPGLRRLWDNEALKTLLFPYAMAVNLLKAGDTVEFILKKTEGDVRGA